MVQEVREPKGRHLEDPGSLAGVKHVDDVDPKVPLEPLHVRVGAVKDLFSVAVFSFIMWDG